MDRKVSKWGRSTIHHVPFLPLDKTVLYISFARKLSKFHVPLFYKCSKTAIQDVANNSHEVSIFLLKS
jgi:hypothetical protein